MNDSALLYSPIVAPALPASTDLLTAAGSVFDAASWRNAFFELGQPFYSIVQPSPLPTPYPVAISGAAAALIGVDPSRLVEPAALAVLAGNQIATGAQPLAAVYSGHQFGVYVPRLGDGRAILLGGIAGPDGIVWELQLKGAGQTPYSRAGDGRAVLRSSIREFLCSEAMHGLGIPTTRALSVVGADQPVLRETVESAAVVTRMAPSFVRFGSFEYFFWTQQYDALRRLADYVIDTFYPACRDARQPYLAWLEAVTRRTAELIAQWQAVGFCHGVLNTDNLSILGLTLDYGPFGFIDGFDAGHICNHSDDHGRYAYNVQPQIGQWNMFALAQALIPLTEDVAATEQALARYQPTFQARFGQLMRAKIGLTTVAPDDEALIDRLLALLDANRTDWTIFFRRLSQLPSGAAGGGTDAIVRDLFVDRNAFDGWARDYRARLQQEPGTDAERAQRMNRVNPKYILRNYLAEAAIAQADGRLGARDFTEVARLHEILAAPFDEQPAAEAYAALPPDWAASLHLSCSS